jgi:hypothetical protein
MKSPRLTPMVRLAAIAGVFLLLTGTTLVLQDSDQPAGARTLAASVRDDLPNHREPPPPKPKPQPPPPPPQPVVRAPLAPGGAPTFGVVCPPVSGGAAGSPPAPPSGIQPYEGLGAWIDIFDYAIRDCLEPATAVDALVQRGVKTLYLQTSRYKQPQDIVFPEAVNLFLERAHQRGIRVVGWYVPGFGDLERDVRRSLAVLNYSTPAGHRFDGFAADIESREEVGTVEAFNAAIVEYSRRLRGSVPPGTVIGAIVVDAKNNERAPARWAGFPWGEIAQHYDVVMPMAYWTVTKGPAPACFSREYDAAGYIREVVSKTQALMGSPKPMHVIGGIADCTTLAEVAGYVTAAGETSSIGGSTYDFATIQANPAAEGIWAELGRLNE